RQRRREDRDGGSGGVGGCGGFVRGGQRAGGAVRVGERPVDLSAHAQGGGVGEHAVHGGDVVFQSSGTFGGGGPRRPGRRPRRGGAGDDQPHRQHDRGGGGEQGGERHRRHRRHRRDAGGHEGTDHDVRHEVDVVAQAGEQVAAAQAQGAGRRTIGEHPIGVGAGAGRAGQGQIVGDHAVDVAEHG